MKNYVNKIDRLNGFYIHSQYNPEFIEGARKLGGKWSSEERAWYFMDEVEPHVKDLCLRVYGKYVDEVGRVDLRVRLKPGWYADKAPLIVAGRILARAFGRDSGAKMEDGVIALQGGFTSGGSMKHWDTRTKGGEDTVAVIYHVPRQKALEIIDDLPDGVLEATIEGEEQPIDTQAYRAGRKAAGVIYDNMLANIEAEASAARAELGDVEGIEAFDEDYKRGVLDVIAEKVTGAE